jgi:glutathione synthase/RimK-type ligase-like ATP-grasp enzyme
MVLCITHSKDYYTIDIVQQSLEQAGIPTFRLNSDEFAINYRMKYIFRDDVQQVVLEHNGREIDAASISGVWYRKLWKLQTPADLDPVYQEIFVKEYQTYLQLFFNQLSHVPWMNDMQTDHIVGHDKLMQLSAARSAGLRVPDTVFTNDPAPIKELFQRYEGNIVVKLHGALSKSMEGNTPFFPTTRLSAKDMQRLDELAYCPMIFQEYIAKAYELRIIYVDGDFFTGKIPHDQDTTDWRVLKGDIEWQPYQLPAAIEENITHMMHNLGLAFGAIDMIRQPGGEYIFLEVNPQGEWGMLQKYLSYPIGETIAQKLITRINNEQEKSIDHYAYKR